MIRNIDAGDYLESFLVSGVAMLIGVRLYLELTGYPQVGGDGLHIAHMLWGGLLMLVAQVILLTFLGRKAHHVAAIAGGAGFGLFIDELGKFITSDNNYFFRPAIALIYVVFVLLFLAFRVLERRGSLTPAAYLVNALNLLGEAAIDDLDSTERDRALACLEKSDPANPLTMALREAISRVELVQARRPGLAARAVSRSRRLYLAFVRSPLFRIGVVGGFLIYICATFGSLIGVIVADPRFESDNWAISFADGGQTFASLLSAGLALIGIIRLRVSRLAAYRWFKRAILVAIFLTQFFAFYSEQLVALFGLALNILLLVALDYVLGQERDKETLLPGDTPVAGAGGTLPSAAGR